MIVQFLNMVSSRSTGSPITCSHSSSSVATALRRSRRIRSLAAVSRTASACGARIRLRHARNTARTPAAGLMRSKRNGQSSRSSQSSSIASWVQSILFIGSLAPRARPSDSHETRVHSARAGYHGKNGRGIEDELRTNSGPREQKIDERLQASIDSVEAGLEPVDFSIGFSQLFL